MTEAVNNRIKTIINTSLSKKTANIMVCKLKKEKGFRLFWIMFVLVFSDFSLQAQNQLDINFKGNTDKYYNMEYQVPKDYHGIEVRHFPLYYDKKYIRSSFNYGIKHKKHAILVVFALIIPIPPETPRSEHARKILGDPSIINLEAIASEIDTTFSKMKYLDTLQLKKVNTNKGVIYNMKINVKYMGVYGRCKKIELYKEDIGRVEILFFYNKGNDALVDEEINRTWGMLKFKS